MLHWACYFGHFEIVSFILRVFKKIDINDIDESNYTGLDLAIIKGYYLNFIFLIKLK